MTSISAIVNTLENAEIQKALDMLKKLLFESPFLLHSELTSSQEKRKRINLCIDLIRRFIIKLQSCNLEKLNEELFHLSLDFIRNCDVEKTSVVALFRHLAWLTQFNNFEICLKCLSLAICYDDGNNLDTFLTQFLSIKTKANLKSNELSFLTKTVVEFFENTSINREIDVYKILRKEFSLYKQRKASLCCDKAVKFLTSVDDVSFSKWKILCDSYVWKHLCLIQEKRDAIVEEFSTSISSSVDMFDEKNNFNVPTSKIACSVKDFFEFASIDEAFEIWQRNLVADFDQLENTDDKNECLQLGSVLSNLALLIPKPLIAIKILTWLVTKRSSFTDWLSLTVLLYETNDLNRLKCFFDDRVATFSLDNVLETCLSSIVDVASYFGSDNVEMALETFTSCEKILEEKLDTKTTAYYRCVSLMKYFSTYFLRRSFEAIPERFKSYDNSISSFFCDSYRRALGILKANLGVDTDLSKAFKHQSGYVIFDVVSCMRRTYDLATSYDRCGLPREAAFYFTEGFDLARRLAYPYWVMLFLTGYLRVQCLCDENETIGDYLEAAQNLFGLLPTCTKKLNEKSTEIVVNGNEDENLQLLSSERLRREKRKDVDSIIFVNNNRDKNYANMENLRHNERCACLECEDFLIYSLRIYFLDLFERFERKNGENNEIFDDLFVKMDLYRKKTKSTLLSIEKTLPAPNFVAIFTPFLFESWLRRTNDFLSAKQFSKASNFIQKISQHLVAEKDVADFYVLTFNFLKTKLEILSSSVDDLCDDLAALRLKGKKKPSRAKSKRNDNSRELNCILKNLSDFGHLLYFPWYRDANEFVFTQEISRSKQITNVPFHLSECFGIAVRHTCQSVEYKKTTEEKSTSNRLQRFQNLNDFTRNVAQIPQKMTVLLLYLTLDGQLILARVSSRCDPLVVNLGVVAKKFDALTKMKACHVDNKTSVKLRDKDEFWTKRFDIDSRLKTLLENVENEWFGVYKALLLGCKQDENFLNDKKYGISDAIFEVLVSGASYLNEKELQTLCANLSTKPTCTLLKRLSLNKMFETNLPLDPVILVLDKNLHSLPFESMPILRNQPVSRSVSLHAIVDTLENWRSHNVVDPNDVYYILNPSNDLAETQKFFETSFAKSQGWTGCVGKEPFAYEIQNAVTNKNLIIYCGHGSGYNHGIGSGDMKLLTCCATVFLMGCSSGKFSAKGSFYEPSGGISVYQIMCCPSVVGCLWDVTDRDIDCYLEHLLCIWLRYKNGKPSEKSSRKQQINDRIQNVSMLQEALAKSRQFCKLRYLTGSAPVVYGLPVDALR